MPFAISIGDSIAVAKLILDITKSLGDIDGAKSDYQELIRELETLQNALAHIDSLQATSPDSRIYDSIKFAALSCRQPLEEFLRKVKKYEKSLGLWCTSSAVKAAKDKLQWTFGHKDTVDKLQKYLNVHIGTINMMLTEYGLESMAVATSKANMDNVHLQERLDNTRALVERIGTSVQGQDLIIRNMNSLMTRLYNMISGEFKASWQSLFDMVTKVCVSTQQIYGVLLEIKSSVGDVDTRWTFFQAPFVVEDAFGFRFPVPSEYDYTMLNNIIQWRFEDRESSAEIKAGNYELYKTQKSNEVISVSTFLTPGTFITMAVIVHRSVQDDECCPMPHCGSWRSTITPSGGRKCADCNVCFDQATKPRRSLEAFFSLLDDRDEGRASNNRAEALTNPMGRHDQDFSSSAELRSFRHVRWADNVESESFENDVVGPIPDIPLQSTEQSSQLDEETSRLLDNPKTITVKYDANEYLDQVRAEGWQVFNPFLDIMVGFKEEKYDTPGVIDLVCKLFHNSPSLLLGFNKFLPTGYLIDVVEQDKSRCIRTRTPMGSVTESDPIPLDSNSDPKDSPNRSPKLNKKRKVVGQHSVARSKRHKKKQA